MGLQAIDRRLQKMPWMRPRTAVRKAAGDTAEIARLLDQQAQVESQIKQAFLDAIDKLGERIDTQAVADMLRAGRVDQAIALVNQTLNETGFRAVTSAVSQAALAAGAAAVADNETLNSFDASFGVTNPTTVNLLRTYEFNLIRGLTSDARASVSMVIQQGIADGRNPLDMVSELRDIIGLTPRQTQAVLNYRDALESPDSTALDRALRDKRFDPSVERALRGEGGLPPEKVKRMVERYRQRYLGYRAATIARTESIRAVNRGNMEAWRQNAADGKFSADEVVRQWVFTHDDKTREAHRLIPDMNPDGVGMDEPFDSILGPILYPGDPLAEPSNTINCRCTVIMRYQPGRNVPAEGARTDSADTQDSGDEQA